MRRLLFILFAMSCLASNAQDNYKKLLTDGKVWKCQLVSDYVSAVVYEPYTVSVEGDTIVDGRECKKLSAVYDKDGRVMYGYTKLIAYEENGKVYAYKCPFAYEPEGDWALMLDFTLHKGSGATKNGYTVETEDTVEVGGSLYRRLDMGGCYWIDGIGPSVDNWACYTTKPTHEEHSEMLACYENGKLLFTKDDFTKKAYNNTENGLWGVSVQKGTKGAAYDLGGRKLNAPRKGEVYIRDGVKRVEK